MKEGICLLTKSEISLILDWKEPQIIDMMEQAYVDHSNGKSVLPQSVFIRFPVNQANRIIGLPAYLGGNVDAAGIKWISSFPDNIHHGLERASAVLLLNNLEDGYIKAILESSVISAKRTAASAALAAKLMHTTIDEEIAGIVGCGRINQEVLRFLKAVFKKLKKVVVFDTSRERANSFIDKARSDGISFSIASTIVDLFSESPLISFATTAGTPYLFNPSILHSNSTILGISLRDLSPEIILAGDNIVDDIEHVFRENTSIHLTEKIVSDRSFVRCSISEIITNHQPRRVDGKASIFSPFGLGVLDVALGNYLYMYAKENNIGITINNFYD